MKDEPTPQGAGEPSRVFRTREQTRAFYDKLSKVYDLLAEHSEAPVRDRGLELLDARAGETVLEIGCGTGHCLVSLARAVGPAGRVYGLDLSAGMLDRASQTLDREGLEERAMLIAGDATDLPHDDDSIDCVFMSFTLELFDTPEIAVVVAECLRVLRPGGRIVIVGLSKGDGHDKVSRAFEWTHEHFPNFVDCRPIHVRRALEAAGFFIQETELMHMWVPVELVLAVKPVDA